MEYFNLMICLSFTVVSFIFFIVSYLVTLSYLLFILVFDQETLRINFFKIFIFIDRSD